MPEFLKNAKLEEGRLGRYKNRNEAGKKVTGSWDRDLSIGEIKRVLGDPKIAEKNTMFLVWATSLSSPCYWEVDFDCFGAPGGSESSKFVLQIHFLFQISWKMQQ